MINPTTDTSRDWLGSKRTSLLAWWIPLAAIITGLFIPVSLRTPVWVIALGWMGAACMLNARRCNRTHCRYTGPYYLAMIVPVFVLGTGVVSAGIYGWISLGLFIVGGSGLIWWATERTWGKFS
jgi:asparagine N-glycosylation enzyme membrane subunit Stt3